ncbi:hypothetical protein ACFQVD_26940 [Streptosporangium amethystogenes subsp. fukuiense]|uniref:Uncharacterized protein n=1 Tax=Streptosporangium amethystogenes subsp. fukuiense TaxID=698418 RepID=A0ABW2T8C2_9ACTN
MSAPLSPREMQEHGAAYLVIGVFARCEDLRRLDREADREPFTS